jgi:hypothetical protein
MTDDVEKSLYPHVMVVDGNDDRGIYVGPSPRVLRS